MAMSSRSTRNTTAAIMVEHSTPGSVGPGTYGGLKLSTGKQPNFAAFASSNARNLNQNTLTSAHTPGPGSYLTAPRVRRRMVSSNVFKTAIARLAPSAPGSTMFRSSTIADNPGPGQYRDPFKEPASGPRLLPNSKGASAASRVVKATGSESAALRFNPPTIPRKEQSNGYDTSDRGPMPLPMPGDVNTRESCVNILYSSCQAAQVFTGLGPDTVGPAFYNLPKTLRSDGTTFGKSNTQRQVCLRTIRLSHIAFFRYFQVGGNPATMAPKLDSYRPRYSRASRTNYLNTMKIPESIFTHCCH